MASKLSKPRKARTDSIPNMVRVMQALSSDLKLPPHVKISDHVRPFFENVVAEFARADWSQHQLELAVLLARSMAVADREQLLLEEEGMIKSREVKDKTGKIVIKIIEWDNPRARIVQSTMGQILSLRRSLALHAKAKSGTNLDAAKQRDANKKTERAVAANEDDGLLA